MSMSSPIPTYNEQTIRALAHQRWLDEGRPEGQHEIHWQWALTQLASSAQHSDIADAPLAAPVTGIADDVSLIDGIGPKIAKQLASAGIVNLSQIAVLNEADLAKLDTKLGLKGRSARHGWISQAKRLIAGKKPQAKSDRARTQRS